ncbi:pickpocket protein 28-like isoform X1 [Harmonia axyridis]|uniref:pickpocket protein 28-like isoform X1 n=2 Tax=Harmonia axyridis TaxID=115357 RepID=UPI001E275170|nr:pickpocket protein 28-like isoform X1 [Harmonia axyridis]
MKRCKVQDKIKSQKMMIGSYNTIRPRKPINGFPIHPEDKKSTIFQIDDFYKRKNKDIAIQIPPASISTIKTKKKAISAPVTKKFLYQMENYCDNTTLHGLRYVGDPTLSLCERLFWFCAFGIAACMAGYFISNIYVKWSESPVIISFSPSDADLNSIPFPSITICNMNQAKRQEAERIVDHGTPAQKKLLNDYCNLNSDMNETEYETDWDTMQNFLITVGQSCSDMLKSCSWKNEKVNCDEYFNNDLTDEGLCCSFNRLPPNKIYWNPKSTSYLNQTYSNYIYDWNPEDGFPDKISDARSDYIPRRPLGSGQHLGLSIILDTQVDNYYCSSTNSVGFKIVLANPLETPKTADFGFLLSPGVEARYMINPVIREATHSLRSVSIEKRQCYFSNERKLQYYRSYTSTNCYQECQSNYTLRMCGCIPYFLPQSRGKRICGKRDENCAKKAQEDTNIVYGRTKNCDCLPACAEVSFTKTGSLSPLIRTKGYSDIDLDNYTYSYLKENIAVVHFFFFKHRYGKEIKSEIYGFTDFLSNTGGLLGAFLGFSILSLVECFYHIFIKTSCLDLRSWNEKRKRKAKKKKLSLQYLQ